MTLLAENTAGAKIITAPFEKVIKQIGEESYSAFLVNYEDRTHELYNCSRKTGTGYPFIGTYAMLVGGRCDGNI